LIKALQSSNASPKIKTINPATEQVLNEYEIITKDQLNNSINKARQAFLEWKNNVDRRADFFMRLPRSLKNKESLARTVTQEMGKAIKEAKSEVEKCAWAVEYYADHGKIFSMTKLLIRTQGKYYNISACRTNR
jgi:acyl-CoA reductase-like NAD-dependent aldehyde dehydrogenase